MEPTVQLVNPAQALSTVPPPEPGTSSNAPKRVTPLSSRPLVKIWLLGIGAWPHKWTSALGELPFNDDGSLTAAGALWASQLAGIPERAILEAVHHYAGRSDWPPSLAEIRKRALGIPSIEEVRSDIGARKHGFTRLVWVYLDHWTFSRADQRDAERQLRNAYDYAVERRMEGVEYPAAPAGELEHKPEPYVPVPDSVALQRFAEVELALAHPGQALSEQAAALQYERSREPDVA
jgi:hypothetical protein